MWAHSGIIGAADAILVDLEANGILEALLQGKEDVSEAAPQNQAAERCEHTLRTSLPLRRMWQQDFRYNLHTVRWQVIHHQFDWWMHTCNHAAHGMKGVCSAEGHQGLTAHSSRQRSFHEHYEKSRAMHKQIRKGGNLYSCSCTHVIGVMTGLQARASGQPLGRLGRLLVTLWRPS